MSNEQNTSEKMMFPSVLKCFQCLQEVDSDWNFCTFCGISMSKESKGTDLGIEERSKYIVHFSSLKPYSSTVQRKNEKKTKKLNNTKVKLQSPEKLAQVNKKIEALISFLEVANSRHFEPNYGTNNDGNKNFRVKRGKKAKEERSVSRTDMISHGAQQVFRPQKLSPIPHEELRTNAVFWGQTLNPNKSDSVGVLWNTTDRIEEVSNLIILQVYLLLLSL